MVTQGRCLLYRIEDSTHSLPVILSCSLFLLVSATLRHQPGPSGSSRTTERDIDISVLCVWCWTLKSPGRQLVREGQCKVEEIKRSWNPEARRWTDTSVSSCCFSPWWCGCPAEARAFGHGAKYTHLSQELAMLKEEPREGVKLHAQLLLHTSEVSQQTSSDACELHNGCCFPSTFWISQDSPLWCTLTQSKQKERILGNLDQPSQVDIFQSHHSENLLKAVG